MAEPFAFSAIGVHLFPAGCVRSEGPACQVRLLEGRACHVRCTTLDYPFRFIGHDKRAPRPSEGPACRVRGIVFDNPFRFSGRDRYAPPNGHDKRAPPSFDVIAPLQRLVRASVLATHMEI